MKKKLIKNYTIDKNNNSWKYDGNLYFLDLNKKSKLNIIICVIFILLLYIISGFLSKNISNYIYFSLPFTTQSIPIFLIIISTYYIMIKTNPYTENEFILSYKRMKNSSIALFIIETFTMLGTLYLAFYKKSFFYNLILEIDKFIITYILVYVLKSVNLKIERGIKYGKL